MLPGEIERWQFLEERARNLMARYGYSEVRTPIFEETELFARSIGTDTDIVQKEMYTFTDRNEKSLTLRPEGTAPVVRACVENNLFATAGTLKLFYIGPMFRHERPQKGRYRQFHQIGAEVLGSDHPAVDAEVIEMMVRFLEELEIGDYQLHLNSIGCPRCRPAYLEVLNREIAAILPNLCVDCKRRALTNPLRVLDCKVEADQPYINSLPSIADYLCEECRTHFSEVQRLLGKQNVVFQLNFRLVRGLDYYQKTTFEITSSLLGAQNSLLGGGRYDGLSQSIGGPAVSGFGFALGQERFILALPQADAYLARPQVYLAPIGPESFDAAVELAVQLRRSKVVTLLDFDSRSLKSQLRHADKSKARFALIFGKDELEKRVLQCRDLSTGNQKTIPAKIEAILAAISGVAD